MMKRDSVNVRQRHVVNVYNDAAMLSHYEQLTRQGLTPIEQSLIQRYLSAGSQTLVLGCGMGREFFALQRQGFSVTGLDIAWEMLKFAGTDRARLSPTYSLNLHQGDVCALPYHDASFEHVLMLSQTIQHLPTRGDRRQALREMYRVLQPGGISLLSAFHGIDGLLALLLQGRAVRRRKCSKPPSQVERLLLRRCSRLDLKGLRRLVWECDPRLGAYTDPLPFFIPGVLRTVFLLRNRYRRLKSRIFSSSDAMPEPNDFFLDFPNFRLSHALSRGSLFMHFPEVQEMLTDIAEAGFHLLAYRSVEELQQNREFSEEERRAKRLLFYAVRKP